MTTPRVDLTLFNARVYDISTIQIITFQDFSLKVQSIEKLEWFTNNDEVLDLKVVDNVAEVKANVAGKCTILIMNSSRQIVRELHVTVVDTLLPEADKLDVIVESVVPK